MTRLLFSQSAILDILERLLTPPLIAENLPPSVGGTPFYAL